jgi:hypothetical protein
MAKEIEVLPEVKDYDLRVLFPRNLRGSQAETL